MAVLGPLVFFAVWPWMWFDIADRVSDYVRFHLGHYGIYFLYFGRLYEKDPFAPWHMPIVMASITVPLAISALAGTGFVAGLRSVLRRVYWGDAARHADPSTQVRLREGELVLWLSLNAMSCLAVVAFSGGAKYGGAKLFMPFFPFWALLAGYGALRLIERARASAGRWCVGGTAAALTMAVLASVSHHYRFRDTPLSQYNALVDGLRGATAAGFERQYYDLAFRDLVGFISTEAPPGTRIYFLPNNWEYRRTFPWYHKEGTLRPDVRVVGSEREADWVVLTHERRFRRYGGDLIRARKSPILKEKRVDGVPLWTILERRPR